MTSPLATYRHCPYCGTAYPTQNAEALALECTDCHQHVFANLPVTASAVIFSPDQQQILLTRRAHAPQVGFLDIPGGFSEPSEHPEQTLTREIQEELGITVHSHDVFGIFSPIEYRYEDRTQYNCDIFYHVTVDPSQKLQPGDDVASAHWFSVHRLPQPEEMAFSSGQKLITELRKTYTQEAA